MDPAAQQSFHFRDFSQASLPQVGAIETAKLRLDAHVQEMMKWHFSDDTGCPYWLDMRSSLGFDPIKDIRSFDDLVARFPTFDAGVLKYNAIDHLIPRGFAGEPYSIYLTGGTTSGAPSRRRVGATSRSITKSLARASKSDTFPMELSGSTPAHPAPAVSLMPSVTSQRFVAASRRGSIAIQ